MAAGSRPFFAVIIVVVAGVALRVKPAVHAQDNLVLPSIARVDGGIVVDRDGRLRAFGVILRNAGEYVMAQDGGRTAAAVHASRFGPALQISEDGSIAFYRGSARVWEI